MDGSRGKWKGRGIKKNRKQWKKEKERMKRKGKRDEWKEAMEGRNR